MKKNIIYIAITLIIICALAFAYYTISPLFISIKADDTIPVAELPTSSTTPTINVIGTTAHPASGTVRLITIGDERYIRYENFKTINGPDIYVYLSKDIEAKDFVSLGRVKATEGNINYKIPEGVSIEEYPYVITWCKAFGVLFNYAKLI